VVLVTDAPQVDEVWHASSAISGLWRNWPCRRLTSAFPFHTLVLMEVQLTRDQEAFVREAIEAGRIQHEQDAVREALSLWEDRERARAEILAAVDEAEASLLRGEGRNITEEAMRELAAGVKQRGRARLAAEQSTPR
jgi:Arc/MetJ-type ribon-helix-helix transcriptional regulator